jgi:DNA-binding transcriptional LysR family regulator
VNHLDARPAQQLGPAERNVPLMERTAEAIIRAEETPMDDLNDLALFAMVVEHQGFSAASRQMGVPKSRLSRRIALLEERLGVRLLQRSSRSLTVTSVGQLFYERCKAIVQLGESAHEVVEEAVSEPRGLIKICCPISLAQFWLTPLLSTFMHGHPQMRIALTVTNRPVDPVDESMDVVLRVRRPPFADSSLIVRPLGRTTDVLMASPALMAQHGEPPDVQALSRWPTLSLPSSGDRHSWRLKSGAEVAEVEHTPRLITDDMFALKSAALDGVGVALLPEIICGEELRSGSLQKVLPRWSCDFSEIQAVFPSRRGMLPAVRAFIDFLAAHPASDARPRPRARSK